MLMNKYHCVPFENKISWDAIKELIGLKRIFVKTKDNHKPAEPQNVERIWVSKPNKRERKGSGGRTGAPVPEWGG